MLPTQSIHFWEETTMTVAHPAVQALAQRYIVSENTVAQMEKTLGTDSLERAAQTSPLRVRGVLDRSAYLRVEFGGMENDDTFVLHEKSRSELEHLNLMVRTGELVVTTVLITTVPDGTSRFGLHNKLQHVATIHLPSLASAA
jgi:hypothetical protein